MVEIQRNLCRFPYLDNAIFKPFKMKPAFASDMISSDVCSVFDVFIFMTFINASTIVMSDEFLFLFCSTCSIFISPVFIT